MVHMIHWSTPLKNQPLFTVPLELFITHQQQSKVLALRDRSGLKLRRHAVSCHAEEFLAGLLPLPAKQIIFGLFTIDFLSVVVVILHTDFLIKLKESAKHGPNFSQRDPTDDFCSQ